MTREEMIMQQMKHQAKAAFARDAQWWDEWFRDPEAVREHGRMAEARRDRAGMDAAFAVIRLWWGDDATTEYAAGAEFPCRVGHAPYQGVFTECGRGKSWAEAVEAARPQ